MLSGFVFFVCWIIQMFRTLIKVGFSQKGIHFRFLGREKLRLRSGFIREMQKPFLVDNKFSPLGYEGEIDNPRFIPWEDIIMITRGRTMEKYGLKGYPFLEIWTTQNFYTVTDKDEKILLDIYNQFIKYKDSGENYTYDNSFVLSLSNFNNIAER